MNNVYRKHILPKSTFLKRNVQEDGVRKIVSTEETLKQEARKPLRAKYPKVRENNATT